MDLTPYTRYSGFDLEHDFAKELVISTRELLALDQQPGDVLGRRQVRFEQVEVKYTTRFHLVPMDPKKPAVAIPTRDHMPMLEFTLANLSQNKVIEHGNVIVVDDRSSQGGDVLGLCQQHGVSCVRVENTKGFNFSMLNNIAAYVGHQHGIKELVTWNNDLWTPDPRTFGSLLAAHRKGKHTITGTRLLYPSKEMLQQWARRIDLNVPPELETLADGWQGAVQFGGSIFLGQPTAAGQRAMVPHHTCRLFDADHHRVRCDRPESFVTGAFCIIDMDWFVDAGGFNVSLAKTLQDVDLCLRACEQGRKVMYLGKKHHLLHAEGTTISGPGLRDRQFASDALLYTRLWKDERIIPVLAGVEPKAVARAIPAGSPRKPGVSSARRRYPPKGGGPLEVERIVDHQGLPITVVVPLSANRQEFFEEFCLPGIRANRPGKVLVVRGEGGACRKRNLGFSEVDTPYVFFCDDDVVLARDCLPMLLAALEQTDDSVGYAYGDYLGICVPPATHPLGPVFVRRAQAFDGRELLKRNYISTMTLVRSEVFCGFDEKVPRLQDWDLWLTLLQKGVEGLYVPGVMFHAYYLDQGITSGQSLQQAATMIRSKHQKPT